MRCQLHHKQELVQRKVLTSRPCVPEQPVKTPKPLLTSQLPPQNSPFPNERRVQLITQITHNQDNVSPD